jgi:hypothetical protein
MAIVRPAFAGDTTNGTIAASPNSPANTLAAYELAVLFCQTAAQPLSG